MRFVYVFCDNTNIDLLGLGKPSTFSFRFSPSILKLISLVLSVFKLIKLNYLHIHQLNGFNN